MIFVRIDAPNGISYSTADSPDKVGEWMARIYLVLQKEFPHVSVHVEILGLTD